MSRTLNIVNGPSFRGFALANGIVSETNWDQVFTMDQEVPDSYNGHHEQQEDGRKKFQMALLSFGRAKISEVDDFIFIGNRYSSTLGKQLFYFGTYNIRTRTGSCEEADSEEFFSSGHALRVLFPDLAPK